MPLVELIVLSPAFTPLLSTAGSCVSVLVDEAFMQLVHLSAGLAALCIGGLLIGVGASFNLLATGRITGYSGITDNVLQRFRNFRQDWSKGTVLNQLLIHAVLPSIGTIDAVVLKEDTVGSPPS